MNSSLAPKFSRSFGDYWVLWYEISNSFSVIDNNFKNALDAYLNSESMPDFAFHLAKQDAKAIPLSTSQTLEAYLENCNSFNRETKPSSLEFDESYRAIKKYYSIQGKILEIYYDSELVAKTIHPAIAHLSVETCKHVDITFDVYIKHKKLHLFENKNLLCCTPQQEYHRLQGKFNMHLFCFLHNKTETDWIGTFHGSTITDGNSSLLIIGESGKGKSTLCAILVANGFGLLADDLSPMLSGTKSIYYNPSAISVKEGAFNLLSPLVKGFDNLPIVQFNKSKGLLKYLPCTSPFENAYPCKAIILVNYQANAETRLEKISIKTLLETLIPESWLSPNPLHAREFLDWISAIDSYELTYSDSKSIKYDISQLFFQNSQN